MTAKPREVLRQTEYLVLLYRKPSGPAQQEMMESAMREGILVVPGDRELHGEACISHAEAQERARHLITALTVDAGGSDDANEAGATLRVLLSRALSEGNHDAPDDWEAWLQRQGEHAPAPRVEAIRAALTYRDGPK